MWFLVVVLTTALVGSTVAIAPCSDFTSILDRLKVVPECYEGGQHPELKVGHGVLNGLAYISPDVLPEGTKCVMGTQIEGKGITFLKKNDDTIKDSTYKQTVDLQENFIHEEDAKGIKYQIWPIRNKNNVYFYYRCIETPGEKGTGNMMASIFVKLGQSENRETVAEVDKAHLCVKKLGLVALTKVSPCY